jgi:hypothetical protein
LALLTKKKMGVMVRKGFITPQNKQHEKQYRFKIVGSFILIFFSSQKLKAQKLSDSLCPSIKDMKNDKLRAKYSERIDR